MGLPVAHAEEAPAQAPLPCDATDRIGEKIREILVEVGATAVECPADVVDSHPGMAVACAVTQQIPFTSFKFAWEMAIGETGRRHGAVASGGWKLKEGRYLRRYDAGEVAFTVEFDEREGGVRVVYPGCEAEARVGGAPATTEKTPAPSAGREDPAPRSPESPARPDQVYYPGIDGVTSPRLIHGPSPPVPDAAREAQIDGHVVLQGLIRPDGSVTDLEVLRCDRPGFGFEDAAIGAVSGWRYDPAKKDGVAVSSWITVFVEFKLR